ncbi:MAG TPA: double-strand break repair protein AddB [Rhizobiales bacterium]|nr:double-strand break repair protein AddB [Hyphomicrobiales bacterium]
MTGPTATERKPAKVFSIAPGVPFLETLARSLVCGELIPGFRFDGDPLSLADATIYVPTRRAARALRTAFVDLSGGRPAVLPVIRALGEFDEDGTVLDGTLPEIADTAPPIEPLERILLLAPLVQAWKRRLPGHVAQLYGEDIVVPASLADAIWLARDLAALIDDIETEAADWTRLGGLVPESLAGWWQVTLGFLEIVTSLWPQALAERGRSNPAAHRNARIRAEAARLAARPPAGPVIAAGSTGSIPATADLLSVVARLDAGAVVLPGFDRGMDDRPWAAIRAERPAPSVLGHPQYGLARLIARIGVERTEVVEIGRQSPTLALRRAIVDEALRPAETTDDWIARRGDFPQPDIAAAFSGVSLVEAPTERDEAAAIAAALRLAVATPGRTAALVTGDRNLARRVAVELGRYGIRADDSGGTPLWSTAPAGLLMLMLEAVFRPGDPVPVLALLKHPLLRLGRDREIVRRAVEAVELIALRGGTGRPDVAALADLFETRLEALAGEARKPFWYARMTEPRRQAARDVLAALRDALKCLVAARGTARPLGDLARTTVQALEALGRDADGGLAHFYGGDAGERLAGVLRSLLGAEASIEVLAEEWPDVLAALSGDETVKPSAAGDSRVAIWGALEARLQSVDTLVLGGLNEGSWPRKAQADRLMSRMMKAGVGLEPPERRIGQAAHDFVMAMGTGDVVLARSLRADDAPAVASRWLQRLFAVLGTDRVAEMRARGEGYLALARNIDDGAAGSAFERPCHAPPLEARPKRFSVTEIETLRRDPYAVYAKKVLDLRPLDPLLREPGAVERGTLFHDVLSRFVRSAADPFADDAAARLVECGRAAFAAAGLPADIEAVWWPRFLALVPGLVDWERGRGAGVVRRLAEVHARDLAVGATGATLSGYADRIDLLPAGLADILDFKTGSGPSKGQAHTLLAPQLALEGALLMRGAFQGIEARMPAGLAYVRLRPNGKVEEESILEFNRRQRAAPDLSEEAWRRLERLFAHYADPAVGYLSRAVPFREGDTGGDYDHLARVQEWSAVGSDGGDGE